LSKRRQAGFGVQEGFYFDVSLKEEGELSAQNVVQA